MRKERNIMSRTLESLQQYHELWPEGDNHRCPKCGSLDIDVVLDEVECFNDSCRFLGTMSGTERT